MILPFGLPYDFKIAVPARQWQAAKQRPTQFGDNKNRPSKYTPSRPRLTRLPEKI